MSYRILFLLYLLFFGMISSAEEILPQRLALLIGNGDYNLNGNYDNPTIVPYADDLKYPCGDVDKLEVPLHAAGFKIFKKCDLNKDAFDLKEAEFIKATEDLPKGSIVFVYYSGHGVQLNGRLFAIPVLFQIDPLIFESKSANLQSKFFLKNTFQVKHLFDRLPKNKNVTLVLVIDSCREVPVPATVDYDQNIEIPNPPNSIIQTATTSGQRALDDGVYASVLAASLTEGGDVGTIMNRVGIHFWNLYDAGVRDTYVYGNPGFAFLASNSVPLANPTVQIASNASISQLNEPAVEKNSPLAEKDKADAIIRAKNITLSLEGISATRSSFGNNSSTGSSEPPKVSITKSEDKIIVVQTQGPAHDEKLFTNTNALLDQRVLGALKNSVIDPAAERGFIDIKKEENGIRFDVLWCAGLGEKQRYNYAVSLASVLKEEANNLGIGRVRIKPISEKKNREKGYRLTRNVLRYDVKNDVEKMFLFKIASKFPSGNFFPLAGNGANGKPTVNYVSALICGDVPTAAR